jgi:hypothetical protein
MLGNGSDLLVGGGSYTAGATDNPILPFVYGSPNASNAVDSIYTYDPARGVVPLGASEYATALDGSETAKNVKLNNLTASYAGGTVKSLLLTASATNTVTLTGTLNVTSGLIVRQNSNAKLAGGTINFGSAEGFLYADNGVTWNSALTNDSGNTKGVTLANYFSSVGGVINGTNTYSGPTNIISGSWSFQGGNAIPNGSSVYVHPAVTARLAEGTGNVVEKMARLSGGGPWESGFGNSEDSKSAPAFITVGTGDTVLIGNTSRGAADYDRIVLNGDGVTNGILSPGFDAAGTEIGTLGLYSIASGYVPSTGYAMDMVAGKWMVDVNSTLADLIRAPLSNITVASGVALNINVLAGSIFTDGQSWMIATASGITDVDGGNLFSAITDNSAGFDFTASIADGNKVMVTAVAVPEPFTLLLLGSGGIGLLLRRRNR